MLAQSVSTTCFPFLKLNDAAFDLSNGPVLDEVCTKKLSKLDVLKLFSVTTLTMLI